MYKLLKSFPVPEIPRTCTARGIYNKLRSGNRDVVGYGYNGSNNYKDNAQYPFPSIRFKENTPEIMALREREKCDWRILQREEKKALYRASFCQTYAEFQAWTGRWKFIAGGVLMIFCFPLWMYYFNLNFVYSPRPLSMSLDGQKAQLRRMIDLRVDPIDGLCSKWDYEKDTWKK